MPRPKVPLPSVAHAFLRTLEGRWCRSTLFIFHRWMREHGLALSDLTQTHLETFWQEQERKGLADSTLYSRRCRLHKYLFWLDGKGHLRFAVDPPRLRHMRRSLPEPARRFLATHDHRRHEPMIRNLHDWLHRKRVDLSELTPAHLEVFLRQPIANPIEKKTRLQLHRHLEPYLLWLHEQGLVSFKASRDVCKPFPLPDTARSFVDTMRPVRKATTCDGYVYDLRDLHAWLDAQNLYLETLERDDTARWLKSLADRGLAPATRTGRILCARSYLRWFAEREMIAADPDDLLRTTDLPKIPTYLPRPFPVEADREMQRRFLQDETVYGQALFLMRRSGVRVGELIRLEPRCLDEDLHGNVFLQVPLGKLDNERLVPLDEETRQLTERLQQHCPRSASFLIRPEIGRQTLKRCLQVALKDFATGLDIPGPVVSHRLRHSYATELLNAGVSLVAVMKLLGHRSLRMTMRYAAITQETIVKEYYAAMEKTASRYELSASTSDSEDPDPDQNLRNIISILRRQHGGEPRSQRRLNGIINRLHKLRYDIARLTTEPSQP